MADDSGNNSKRLAARPQPLPVEFQAVGTDERRAGFLSEMTLAGAILEPVKGAALEQGARLRIFVRPFGVDEEFGLRSVVRWERRSGVGVQFFKLGEREIHMLMELIAAAEAVARTAGPTRRTA